MAIKQTDSDHEQSSIPSWLKSTGAIVGILVALSGAIAGAYQVVSSWKQFQLQIAKEERETAEAKFKQAVEENKHTEVEARTRTEVGKQEIVVKQTEFSTAVEKRKAEELGITRDHQAQEAAEKFKIAGEVRTNQRQDENRLTDNIGSLFGKNASGSIATLSRYAKPGDENLSTILTPLVAKLDDVVSSSEVSMIFQLFNKSGPSALNAVLDANRIAFEKYKQDIREIARQELAMELKRRTEAGARETDSYEVAQAVSQRIISAYVPNPGLARLTGQLVFDVYHNSSSSGAVAVTMEWGDLVKHSKLQLDIQSQSKRSLLRLLDPTLNSLDLSGMDLTDIKFPRRGDTAVNFRGACLIGADLSGLTLDRVSLLSILEADVGYFTRYDPSISGSEELFLNSLFSAVHLSKEQKDMLSSPSKKVD